MTLQLRSAFELPDSVSGVVSRNPLPALIVELPSEQILFASPAAQDLFCAQGAELVGRNVESLAVEPSGAFDLLIAGRLSGYETVRQLSLSDGSLAPIQTWVRTIGEEIPPRYVLMVFTAEVRPLENIGSTQVEDFIALIGTTDASLRIDRVGSDDDVILGGAPEEFVGQTIFEIVRPEDLAGLMWALAQSTSTGKGVSLHVHVNRAAGETQLCQMLLLSTTPLTSFAFSLVSVERSKGSFDQDVEAHLGRTSGRDLFGISRHLAGLTETEVPGISKLSSRELDVVTRLLAGYRVPAIGGTLFVSQSTVRNHLSSVFKKLRVDCQQELINLLIARMDETSSDK